MESERIIHDQVVSNFNNIAGKLLKKNIHWPQNGEGGSTEIFE
jgi:hypothetical protein